MDSDWFTRIYRSILAKQNFLQNRDMACKLGCVLFLSPQKKKTAIILFGFIPSACYVDAKQFHLASVSTRNSTLNTSLRKSIRMQGFIQLCDST